MEIIEKQQISLNVITDILCDCCGKSCKVREDEITNPSNIRFAQKDYQFSYMELHANWGFWSNKDLEKWSAKICEKCVDEKLGFIKFNISSQISGR